MFRSQRARRSRPKSRFHVLGSRTAIVTGTFHSRNTAIGFGPRATRVSLRSASANAPGRIAGIPDGLIQQPSPDAGKQDHHVEIAAK